MNICTMLTVLFVALKLLDVIDWSWVAVFSPLIVGAGMVAATFVVCMIAEIKKGGRRG